MTTNHNSAKPIIKAASACVLQGHALLLVLRPGGVWAFPGGKLEAGEAPLAAAKRELAEETGVTANLLHCLGEFAVSTAKADYLITCFAGTYVSGLVTAASDAQAANWWPFDSLATLPLAPHIQSTAALARKLISL